MLYISVKHFKQMGIELAQNKQQTIVWTNADPIHWRVSAAIGEHELIMAYLT